MILNRAIFSEIKIECTAHEKNASKKLTCKMEQLNGNALNVKITGHISNRLENRMPSALMDAMVYSTGNFIYFRYLVEF